MVDIVHVLPIDDIIEHHESEDCPCNPTVFSHNGVDMVITHNSFDGREFKEAKRELN